MFDRLGIIVKEVYRKNVFSWSFFWMIMSPLIMFGVIFLIGFFIGRDQAATSVGNIAVLGSNPEIQAVIEETNPGNIIDYEMNEEQAQSALFADELDGYLVVNEENIPAATYYRKNTSQDISLAPIETALNQYQLIESAAEIGIEEEELNELLATSVTIDSINLTMGETGESVGISTQDPTILARTGVAYAVSIIVFIFIMNYVSIISQEIAAEKGSRIMEIIMSSVSATSHFLGKIIGILLVIITQLLIYIALYYLISFIVQQFRLMSSFPDFNIAGLLAGTGNVVVLGIIYALIGILIYTSLAGFLGSLVSRTEDVNKMITPIVFIALAGFYIGMYALASANSPIVRIASQIPLFTPFIMPFRIASETVGSSELVISIIISLLFMVLTLWFSLVFYKSNVLVYSDKGLINTFKRSFTLWKSERATK